MKKLSLVLFFLFTAFTALFAQDSKHPIDIETDACMEKDPSTMGMIECSRLAQEKWDAEMNKYYDMLMDKLDESAKASLRDSQRRWLEFRDAEFKAIDDYYSYIYEQAGGGTMYSMMQAGARMQVVRDRALEIISYYQMIGEFLGK
jgi:uncharacterized protein YecT (DUF1311 family)